MELRSALWVLLTCLIFVPDYGLAQVKYGIEFGWEEVEDASGYEVQFKDRNSGKVEKFNVKKAEFSDGLPGGNYNLRIRSLDARGVPGDWSDWSPISVLPPDPKVIAPKRKTISQKFKKDNVRFQWESVPGVKKYLVKVKSLSSGFKVDKEVSETSVQLELPVGEKYSYQVFSTVKGVPESDLSAKIRQFIHYGGTPEPNVHQPSNEFVTAMSWDSVDVANKYRFKLFHKKENKWKRLQRGRTKRLRLKVKKKFPGGDYKFQVVAKGKYRKQSKPREVQFYMAPERGPAAVKQALMKEAVERPSLFHATGSYIITNLNYTAVNPERNTLNQFSTLGGSGRAGLAYTPRGTPWGGVGFMEFSGFAVAGQVFTYFTMEAHATWKKTFGSHVLKVTGGGFIRELPETLSESGSGGTEDLTLEKVRFMGPAAGLRYGIPLTEKLGLTFNSQMYMSLISLGTPNGQGVQMTPSFQFSLLGSYRVSRNITGLIGYAYKQDSIAYDAQSSEESDTSFANPGSTNTIDMTGHYLNLMLEWSL